MLTGFAMVAMSLLNVHLGFTFSAGLFDYVINFTKAQRPLLLLPVGLVYFAVYYGLFRLAIQRFNLKTPGREETAATPAGARVIDAGGRGSAYLAALGGAENLSSIDACTTRLRLIVQSNAAIDEPKLKALGAKGIVRPSANALQVVVGPAADQIASEIRAAMNQPLAASPPQATQPVAPPARPIAVGAAAAFVKALGGVANVAGVTQCASRLVVDLNNPTAADDAALRAAGVKSVAHLEHCVHLILGSGAGAVAAGLKATLGAR